ncbi:putative decarboxylase dec1 [Diaporthe ampelina]|uniref:Putative decarboxylase dec1 n=1 Tax=Diaporthe ampelina TaxID=1214573 RepID=A0A0G2FAJ1_9PEZI|nr:putative decarboxylase dec1 [Diaporthe ampelina]
MTSLFIEYGMSLAGSYKEYVYNVEVTYRGERLNYHVILVLDNESAIFAGREQYGFPKVFGKAEIESQTGGRLVTANSQRPAGRTVVDCGFVPEALVDNPPAPKKWSLSLRSIQQPHPGMAAPIPELVLVYMDVHLTEVWTGKGRIDFPRRSVHNPWYELDVVRYEGSILARDATDPLKVQGRLRF